MTRIHDWFTRPAWDDYLAEQQAAVDAMTMYENAQAQVLKLRTECDALSTKVSIAEQDGERLRGQLADKELEVSQLTVKSLRNRSPRDLS